MKLLFAHGATDDFLHITTTLLSLEPQVFTETGRTNKNAIRTQNGLWYNYLLLKEKKDLIIIEIIME